MPCNIGYKNVTRIRVAPKLPQEFKEKVKRPKIDQSLLDNMGIEDTVFLDWIMGLDINPLLEEALRRALRALDYKGNANFTVNNGDLEIRAKFTSAKEKKQLETVVKRVGERFQIEVLAIIAQLMDYKIRVNSKTVGGSTVSILEGEKDEPSSVHKYLNVTVGNNGEGVLTFEHFDSKPALKEERAKFIMLAKKFGIKVEYSGEHEAGQPIPSGVEHRDFLRQGQ